MSMTKPQSKEAAEVLDPYRDQIQYLLSRGWTPLGNPEWQTCLWEDPESPREEKAEKVPVMTTAPDARNPKGPWIKVPVMVDNGSGVKEPAFQLRVTLPRDPVLRHLALRAQIERDRRVQ